MTEKAPEAEVNRERKEINIEIYKQFYIIFEIFFNEPLQAQRVRCLFPLLNELSIAVIDANLGANTFTPNR
jgi:hypothetical protein